MQANAPDIDGDGIVSPWERCVWLCAILIGAIIGRTI